MITASVDEAPVRLWPVTLVAAGLLTLLALIFAGQNWLVGGPYGAMRWPRNLELSLVQWWAWALLAPVVLTAAVRRPFNAVSLPAGLMVYGGLCVATVTLHLLGVAVIERLFDRVTPGEALTTTVMNLAKKRLGLNLLAFWLLVLAGHTLVYRARLRKAPSLAAGPSRSEPLAVRGPRGEVRMVRRDAIVWVEAAGNYAVLHLADAQHLMRGSMDSVLSRLGDRFARVSRSALVNLDEVVALADRTAQGDLTLLLSSGGRVRMTRTYRSSVMKRLPDVH
jgi:hypothetical protein